MKGHKLAALASSAVFLLLLSSAYAVTTQQILDPSSFFQHGGNGSLGYFYIDSQNLTDAQITNSTLTNYTCSGSSCNFTVMLDSDHYNETAGLLNVSSFAPNGAYYLAADGGWRNVSELSSIGQGEWGFNSSTINYTLAGGDGFDYGVRDTQVGGSYWLSETGNLYGKINISNDFITVGMTETELKVYNSSGKVVFNMSFGSGAKVDGQDLLSLYGSGTQNKTVYFFDWGEQEWTGWGVYNDSTAFDDDLDGYASQAEADSAWSTTNSVNARVNATPGQISHNFKRDGTNNAIAYDLGYNVSDEKWVLRFKWRLNSIGGTSMTLHMGLFDRDQATGSNTAQDGIFAGAILAGNNFDIGATDGDILGNGLINPPSFTFAAGTDYYVEVKRTSATSAQTTLYSDSGFGNVLASSNNESISTNTKSLRYIKFANREEISNNGNTYDSTIDDIQFWNGVSSVPTVRSVPDWLDPRNKQTFKWRYLFLNDTNMSRPGVNLTFMVTAHDPFVRTFVDATTPPERFVYSVNGTYDFVVPAGVTSIDVKAWGGGGGGGASGSSGGGGGFARATLSVSPGQLYRVAVGGGGIGSGGSAAGGTNGGGSGFGGACAGCSGGGGGYSGVFLTSVAQGNARVVAGGGGGGAYPSNDAGAGGGDSGIAGTYSASGACTSGGAGGGGGTQASGGAAGGNGNAGAALQGGNGGAGGCAAGGGGGGGYYGGGGGGTSGGSAGGGGGGGSGFVSGGNTQNTAGSGTGVANSGDADYISGTGNGGGTAANGQNGLIVISYNYSHNFTIPISLPENRTSVTTAEPGLVGHWNFEDGRGTNAVDVSEGSNDFLLGAGSSSASPYWVSNSTCKFGGCIGFDGTDDYLLNNNTNFLGNQAGTVAFWFRTYSTSTAQIVWQAVGDNGDTVTLMYRGDLSDEFQYIVDPGSGSPTNSMRTLDRTVSDTNWHFIVVTSDGSTVRMYVDNALSSPTQQEGTNSGQWFGDLVLNDFGAGRSLTDSSNFFRGLMDDMRVYSRQISSEEMRLFYTAGISQQKPAFYFASNNMSSHEEVLFAATSWKGMNRTGFSITSNYTDFIGFNWTFNSTLNQNFLFSLGTMGRMNTTVFSPQNNATQFSSETVESIANSTLTWYDLTPVKIVYSENATYDFVVPEGVTSITVKVWGAGGSTANFNSRGGGGGFVQGRISVTPSQTYKVVVGSPIGGGVGGDANGVGLSQDGGSGGGLTGVFLTSVSQGNARFVAGSGGGGGGVYQYTGGSGGAGGNDTAGNGFPGNTGTCPNSFGRGGSLAAGGAGGAAGCGTGSAVGSAGSALTGGDGGDNVNADSHGGGGGGAGYYGGGGGGSTGYLNTDGGGGGGGGSSFIVSGATDTKNMKAEVAGPGFAVNGQPPNQGDEDYITGHGVGDGKGKGLVVIEYATPYTAEGADGSVQHDLRPRFNYDGGAAGIWKLDEGFGMNATDSSGGGNVGTLIGSPSWMSNSSCVYGSCLSFDGSNDAVKVSRDGVTNRLTGTWEAWIKTNNTGGRSILWLGEDGVAAASQDEIGFGTDNNSPPNPNPSFEIFHTIAGATQSVLQMDVNYTDGRWHHIAFSSDGSKIRGYLDGKEQTIKVPVGSNSGQWFGTVPSANTLCIGGRCRDSLSGPFDGPIDEVRVYNRVLTDQEIREHYQREVTRYYDDFGTSGWGKAYRYFGVEDSNTTLQPLTPYGAALHYRFNENFTAYLVDYSGNGRNGTVNAANWTYNSTCMQGFGGCMIFTGQGGKSYVKAGSDSGSLSDFAFMVGDGAKFTACSWIRVGRGGVLSGGAPYAMLVNSWNNGASTDRGMGLSLADLSGGKYNVRLHQVDGSSFYTDLTFNVLDDDGAWHHLCWTHDETQTSNNQKVYVDSVLKGTGNTNTANAVTTTSTALTIGAYGGTLNLNFNGTVDEVVILNRTLSHDEIYQLYLGGVQRHGGDLVGWWKLNENTLFGNVTLDSSGSGHTGTASNGPAWLRNMNNTQNFASCTTNQCDGNWPSADATNLNIDTATDRISWNVPTSGGVSRSISYDFGYGSVPDYGWKLRFVSNLTAFSSPSANIKFVSMALSDANHTSTSATNQDMIGFQIRSDSLGNRYKAEFTNNSLMNSVTTYSFARTPSVEALYVEIERDSANRAFVRLFSDAGYSTLLEQMQLNISETVRGLRYFKITYLWESGTTNTITGNTRLVSLFTNGSCKHGGCLSFDGTNDYVYVNDSESLNPDSLTVSAWTMRRGNNSDSSNQGIAGKEDVTGNYEGYLLFWDALTPKIRGIFYNGSTGSVPVTSGTLSDGSWVHAAFVIDNQAKLASLYVNGALAASTDFTGSISRDVGIFTIGARSSSPSDGIHGHLNGTVDNVKIWKRALNADEVMNEYLQTQDQHSIYGNIHRIAAADGLQVASFNLTDKDNPYQRDYDQRLLLVTGGTIVLPDTSPPLVTIQSPGNFTYGDNSVWVNATANETSTCEYSVGSGANASMTNSSGNWNALATVSNGAHRLRVYCTDGSGNVGYGEEHFTTSVSILTIYGRSLYNLAGTYLQSGVAKLTLDDGSSNYTAISGPDWKITMNYSGTGTRTGANIFVNDSSGKSGYYRMYIGTGEQAPAGTTCVTNRWRVVGTAVDPGAGSLSLSGTARVDVRGTSFTNSTSFVGGVYDVSIEPCLLPGRLYDFDVLVTGSDGKTGAITLRHAAK